MANNEMTLVIKANSNQLVNALSRASAAVNNFSGNAEKSASKSSGGFRRFSDVVTIAAGNLAATGIHKGIDMISSSIDGAVKRVDTLNNFPKTMGNVGISADKARNAIKKATDGIKGLPTSLDSAAQSIQRLTMKTKDVDKATEIFLALNNAILAGGSAPHIQAAAMEQLSQSFARGKPDLMEWRTAMTAMPAQMDQLAKAMGKVDANALYEDIKDGKISMEQLGDALVKLNTKGSGGLPTFAEQAKNATGGIATGMENAKTAVTRGVAKIIEAFGSGGMSSGVGGFGEAIERVLNKVADLVNFVKANKEVFTGIAIGVGIFTGAVVAYNVAVKLASAATKAWSVATGVWSAATKVAAGAQWLLNKAMSASPIVKIITVIGLLVAGFVWLWNNVEGFRNFFIGAWGGIKSAVDGASKFIGGAIDKIVKVASGVGAAVMGGIGVVVGFIKSIATVIWNAISPVVGFFTSVFSTIWRIVSSTVILIVAIVATIAEAAFNVVMAVVGFFTTHIGGIVSFISGAVGQIINFFVGMVSSIVGHVTGFINYVVNGFTMIVNSVMAVVLPIASWFNDVIIQPVAGFFGGLWNGIVGGAQWFFNAVAGTLGSIAGWINNNVIQPVARFFGGLWNGVTSGIKAAASVISNVMGTIAGFVKAPINGIIDIINGIIDGINKVKVPDWVPGLGGKSPNFPRLPRLATGGIVSPQGGGSIIYAGDGGQNEWVVPESKMASLVSQINRRLDGTGGGVTKNITVNNTYNVRDRVDSQMVASDLGYLLSQA